MSHTIDMTNSSEREDEVIALRSAIPSTYRTALNVTPGQMEVGRGVIFNIQHKADYQLIP